MRASCCKFHIRRPILYFERELEFWFEQYPQGTRGYARVTVRLYSGRFIELLVRKDKEAKINSGIFLEGSWTAISGSSVPGTRTYEREAKGDQMNIKRGRTMKYSGWR